MALCLFGVIIFAIQIYFFKGDYIFWALNEPLSPLSLDQMSSVTMRIASFVLSACGFFAALRKFSRWCGLSKREYGAIELLILCGVLVAAYQVQLFVVHVMNMIASAYLTMGRFLYFLWPSYLIVGTVVTITIVIALKTNNNRSGTSVTREGISKRSE